MCERGHDTQLKEGISKVHELQCNFFYEDGMIFDERKDLRNRAIEKETTEDKKTIVVWAQR
jgi:hypothetical protein